MHAREPLAIDALVQVRDDHAAAEHGIGADFVLPASGPMEAFREHGDRLRARGA